MAPYNTEVNDGDTLNLSQVTTPAELVEQNNEPTPPETSRLVALTNDLSLTDTYDLVLTLVQRLGDFHQSVIDDLKEEGDLDRLVVWAQDEQTLHHCHDMIREVYNND